MDIGQTLNQRYTLIARLGKGAMGIVYRAHDLQTGQDVAVKVIARELALDHDMLERFRREGEALRQLRHPNIVGFVDMFEHEAQHVIVMEFVPGGSLHDVLRQGPLPLDRARRMALELCDALTRAHHLNIIHRDLKPENVLLAADGTPKLTDFGVARLVTEGTRLTGTGAQVGTPFYMSPEAWEGKPLDAQTDIWSLGILLYEMLSGRVPFSGDTVVAVMNKVLNAPLPDLKTLRPDVPPGLAQIVQRTLARDQSQRYQSMRELAADLERGEPLTMVAARPTRAQVAQPQTVLAGSKSGRALTPWLVGGVIILAVLVLGGVGLGAGWLVFGQGARPSEPKPTPSSALAPSATRTASSVPITSGAPTQITTAARVTAVHVSGAHPPCGPGETELFFDDFEKGLASGWAFGDVAGQRTVAWPVVADGANHVLVGTGHAWAWVPDAPDVALQLRVRRTAADAVTHLNVRLGDAARYYVGFYPDALLVRNPPAPPGLTLAQFPLGNDTAWHTVRLAAVDHHVEVRLDTQLVAQVDDADGPLAGGIGLENTFGTLWYDDVLVCKLANTAAVAAPTAAAGVPLRGSQVIRCDRDLCVVDDLGRNTPLGLAGKYRVDKGFTVSPDGATIAFSGCPADAPAGASCANLYLVDRASQDVKPLVVNDDSHFAYMPAWSPDGQWIAYHLNCALTLIHPDGTGTVTLEDDYQQACVFSIAWSPDSQRLAWIGGIPSPQVTGSDQIRVINQDKSGLHTIFRPANGKLSPDNVNTIGWSPDGKSVAAVMQNQTTYLINVEACSAKPEGCDESGVQTVGAIPLEWLATFWPRWASANKTLRVGVLVPLSGPNAAFGPGARDGAQMAVDEWNGQGGLLGRTILPILADGQCAGGPAVNAANQLFDQEGVRFLIGEICSTASLPVSAIAESKGVVQISPASSVKQVTLNPDGSTKAYVFRACMVDPFQGTVMATFALGQHLQRAFVIWDQTSDYSQGLANYFMDAYGKAGGTIVGNEAYSTQTTDFGPLLRRVADSQAQVLFVPDFSSRVSLIGQQAKAQKLAAVLMGGDGWEGSDLDLRALDGGYYSSGYSALAPNTGAQAWAARYRARFGREADAMAALSYDAANMLFTAIRQANTDDPARVKEVLAGLKFEGVTGSMTFDAQHNPVKSAVIIQIKDGQRVYAATVQP